MQKPPTVGGSLGVGALGGILSAGLTHRLGANAETAGRLLSPQAASSGPPPPVPLSVLGQAIERSLLPVFAILAGLAVLNVALASRFPERERKSAGGETEIPPAAVQG